VRHRTVPSGATISISSQRRRRYPDLDIGSYPFYRTGVFGTSLVLRGRDAVRLAAGTEEVVALVRSLGGNPVEE
jgi:hypothetical protein